MKKTFLRPLLFIKFSFLVSDQRLAIVSQTCGTRLRQCGENEEDFWVWPWLLPVYDTWGSTNEHDSRGTPGHFSFFFTFFELGVQIYPYYQYRDLLWFGKK